ncbi:AAT family amino acid transporter [Lasiodiplodia theobromae]|uniref:Amino-acid permease 1 n=1 Tax=Lasiodiplodia theobromae TaxID=45133 RepID=A0A5N5CY89_9PEZI|nr:Amino-acid permease 1 [Lasiodiplodia theobromae]KAF9641540.1 AAT family amino acid transporter [Lasiodiplodia theobromae]
MTGWTAIVASEAVFFTILVDYWGQGGIPQAALLTIFLVACTAIFLMPNTVFAWFEYVTSVIKIILFLLIIVTSVAILCGAGPNGYVHDAGAWTELPAYKNGFQGFADCALLAVWAVGDQIFIGIMGGEAKLPRMSMGHATTLVPYRVFGIYMTSIILVSLLVRSDNDRLLGGSGAATSPYIISQLDVGIVVIPDILNAGMIIGVLAISAEAVYLASRVLRSMSHQKLIPEAMAKVDKRGRPFPALLITLAVAAMLTFLGLSCNVPTHDNVWEMADLAHSRRYRRSQLARRHHEFFVLHMLDHRFLHLFPIPSRY